jgi:predicted membrane GTPase involved in stress response
MGAWQPEKEKQVDEQGQPVKPQPSAIQQRWTDAIARVVGEEGKEPMSMIDLDVKVVAGSTQPTNRMAKAGVAMEFVKAGIYDPQAALEYIDDPKKDEVTERMERKRKEELQAIAQGQAAKGAK